MSIHFAYPEKNLFFNFAQKRKFASIDDLVQILIFYSMHNQFLKMEYLRLGPDFSIFRTSLTKSQGHKRFLEYNNDSILK